MWTAGPFGSPSTRFLNICMEVGIGKHLCRISSGRNIRLISFSFVGNLFVWGMASSLGEGELLLPLPLLLVLWLLLPEISEVCMPLGSCLLVAGTV